MNDTYTLDEIRIAVEQLLYAHNEIRTFNQLERKLKDNKTDNQFKGYHLSENSYIGNEILCQRCWKQKQKVVRLYYKNDLYPIFICRDCFAELFGKNKAKKVYI